MSARVSRQYGEWDLWMIWSNCLEGYERLSVGTSGKSNEYRVYNRIMKSNVWYVGSRMYIPRKGME